MRVVLDMNFAPSWVEALARHGIDAVHWSTVGDFRASDMEVLQWAKANGHHVLTHDLGYGSLLALGGGRSPSVIHLRRSDLLGPDVPSLVASALLRDAEALERGVVLIVEPGRTLLRPLPLPPHSGGPS